MVTPVRKRQFPVVGDGGGVWSFIHIADAAAATVAAIEHGAPGLYNVVDDEPARVRDWLPGLAQAVQAKPPRHLPRWHLWAALRPNGHDHRGAGRINAKAKRELRRPHYRTGTSASPRAAMTDAELRPVAFAIAYRMLGSVSEAEDAVQEAFLRPPRPRGGERDRPRACLATVVTRLCIDQLRSARMRLERYVGEWLPEPLVGAEDADPARHAEMADSLSMAFMLLLERLARAARGLPAARGLRLPLRRRRPHRRHERGQRHKLVSRARRQVQEGRPRYEPRRSCATSSLGPTVPRFESLLADAVGAPYCAAVSSGTAGIGRIVSDNKGYGAVAVLGQTVVQNLLPDGGDPIGRYVLVNNVPFLVIGVMSTKGASANGTDQDDVIFIPLNTGMLRVFGQRFLRTVTVAVNDVSRMDAVQDQVESTDKRRAAGEDDALEGARVREVPADLVDLDARSLVEREAADAGAECRESERLGAELVGELERPARRAPDRIAADVGRRAPSSPRG
jgi:hypothetical protein